jgi:hypothetical protein
MAHARSIAGFYPAFNPSAFSELIQSCHGNSKWRGVLLAAPVEGPLAFREASPSARRITALSAKKPMSGSPFESIPEGVLWQDAQYAYINRTLCIIKSKKAVSYENRYRCRAIPARLHSLTRRRRSLNRRHPLNMAIATMCARLRQPSRFALDLPILQPFP